MKKIWIFIAIAMVIVMVSSAMSHAFDFEKPGKDNDKTSAATSTDSSSTSGADAFEAQEGMFYYKDGEEYDCTAVLSDIADGTRGFFVSDGITYFAIKHTGDDSNACHLNVTDKTSTYDLCCATSEDVVHVTNRSDEENIYITTSFLFVYYYRECDAPISLHEKLLEDLVVSAQNYDPAVSEGPSAE